MIINSARIKKTEMVFTEIVTDNHVLSNTALIKLTRDFLFQTSEEETTSS